MKSYVLTRDVTQQECPWLDHDLKAGMLLWEYTGYDYGVITPGGVAVSARVGDFPFFEVPRDAVLPHGEGEVY